LGQPRIELFGFHLYDGGSQQLHLVFLR